MVGHPLFLRCFVPRSITSFFFFFLTSIVRIHLNICSIYTPTYLYVLKICQHVYIYIYILQFPQLNISPEIWRQTQLRFTFMTLIKRVLQANCCNCISIILLTKMENQHICMKNVIRNYQIKDMWNGFIYSFPTSNAKF